MLRPTGVGVDMVSDRLPEPGQNVVTPTDHTYKIARNDPAGHKTTEGWALAFCLNEGYARPGAPTGQAEEEEHVTVAANLSLYKLGIKEFQESKIMGQKQIHKMIRDFYAQRGGGPLPAGARPGAGRGSLFTASAGARPAAGASREL